MLLAQHGMLGGLFETVAPVLVSSVADNPGNVSTYPVTPSVTPTNGNLMVIVLGGAQTRSVLTSPTGWVNAITAGGTGGTHEVWTKTASGETGGAYTFGLSGSLQGGISFYEISGVTTGAIYAEFLQFTGSTHLTYTYTTYNVTYPSIAIAGLAGGAFITATINNSFSLDNTLSQRFSSAHRVYSTTASSQSTTWTLNTAQDCSVSLIIFR